MTRWIIAAATTLLAAVLALAALSAYILGASDPCAPLTARVTATRIPRDAVTVVDADAALSPRQIASIAADAGFTGDDLPVAVAVALAESGGRVDAVNAANRDGSSDHGLWQINSIHQASGFDPARAHDPTYNAAWAHRIFTDAGNRWTPWVAYTTGAHRRHMPSAEQAAVDIDPPPVHMIASDLDLAAICAQATPGDLLSAAGDAGAITAEELDAISAKIGRRVPIYSILRNPACETLTCMATAPAARPSTCSRRR
jgi:hypothetical protein